MNGNVRKINFFSPNPRILRNTINRRVAQILSERHAAKGKGELGPSGSSKDDDGGFGWLPGTRWLWDEQLLVQFNKGCSLSCAWENAAHWHAAEGKEGGVVLLINGVKHRVQFQDEKGWPLRAAADRGQRFKAECVVEEEGERSEERVSGTLLPHPGPSRPGWLEGYLVKRSGFAVQEWKVRWVELNLVSGLIQYFEHDRASLNGDRCTGHIDLRATGRNRLTRQP